MYVFFMVNLIPLSLYLGESQFLGYKMSHEIFHIKMGGHEISISSIKFL
jgi:hypothetical protein